MSMKTAEKIFDLETSILQRTDEMNAEEARNFYLTLVSFYEEFKKAECDLLKDYPNSPKGLIQTSFQFWIDLVECVEMKTTSLQKMLRSVFLPIKSKSLIESEVNNQNNEKAAALSSVNLNSLLQKQKCVIQMIDSLVPKDETSSKEAELLFDHVSRFFEQFIFNQNEIITLVEGDAFDDQMNIFKEIQQRVLSLQRTCKEIFSPNEATALPESKVNEHQNAINRPMNVDTILDSDSKKHESLIRQIELIESKNNLDTADAEMLRSYLSQLCDYFIQNQAQIETYVSGRALDERLKISREIFEKVKSLQLKLSAIIVPIDRSISPIAIETSCYEIEKSMVLEECTIPNFLIQSIYSTLDCTY